MGIVYEEVYVVSMQTRTAVDSFHKTGKFW